MFQSDDSVIERKEGSKESNFRFTEKRVHDLLELLLPIALNTVFAKNQMLSKVGCTTVTTLSRSSSIFFRWDLGQLPSPSSDRARSRVCLLQDHRSRLLWLDHSDLLPSNYQRLRACFVFD